MGLCSQAGRCNGGFSAPRRGNWGGGGRNKASSVDGMRPQMRFRQRFLTITMVQREVEGDRGISIPLCIVVVIVLRPNLRGSGQVWFRGGAGRPSSPPRSQWDCAASKPQRLRSQRANARRLTRRFNTAGRVAPAVIETPALGEVVRLNSSGVSRRLVFAGSLAPTGAGFGRGKRPTWLLGL